MNQRSLFNPDPVGEIATAPPRRCENLNLDVRRCVQPKPGPFRELAAGGVTTGREFRILELQDGRMLWEFTDNGELRPATKATTRVAVDDMVRYGAWVEVDR